MVRRTATRRNALTLPSPPIDRYFNHHLPKAASVGKELASGEIPEFSDNKLGFMFQSWVLDLFLDCPPNMGVDCPNATAIAAVEEAIANGHITWSVSIARAAERCVLHYLQEWSNSRYTHCTTPRQACVSSQRRARDHGNGHDRGGIGAHACAGQSLRASPKVNALAARCARHDEGGHPGARRQLGRRDLDRGQREFSIRQSET